MGVLSWTRNRVHRGAESPPESAAFDGGLKPPQPHDWQTYGQAGQVLAGRPGVGHETPGGFAAWMRALGHRHGAARLPDNLTIAEGAPPLKIAANAAKVRIGLANQALMRVVAPLEARIRKAPGLIKALRAKAVLLGQQLDHEGTELDAQLTRLPLLQDTANELKDKLDQARQGYLQLPRMLRGYFDTFTPVILVDTGVVLFDVWVLHGVLEISGLSPVTVWGTSVTVPLAIAAGNHAFGVLAGAIGLRVPAHNRLKLAAAMFVSGLGALVTAFVLLMIFRAVAADTMNAALAALVTGHLRGQLQFFISPLWMGPLQIAGSFAAITMTAFWTLAKEGREYRRDTLEPAATAWEAADAEATNCENEIGTQKQKIAQIRTDIETTVLETYEIEAGADGARGEIIARSKEFEALVNTETALGMEMGEIYRAERNYVRATYVNGGVWQMQLPTRYPWGRRPYTPGPSDEQADDSLIRQRHQQDKSESRQPDSEQSSNHKGDQPIDPDRVEQV